MGAEVIGIWGTWEELLLGGAVLRHGTRDWNVVAAELRARTVCPYPFSPEVCKARYEDLQQRYSGSKAWFEELRKQRVAELRHALKLSENSIGSLESKLETLKAVVSSNKETSKEGLSAGSFTREAQISDWSSESQIPAAAALEEVEAKPEGSQSSEQEKVSSIEKLTGIVCGGQIGSFRRRRGKRKRKYCSMDVKGGSFGESDFLYVSDAVPVSQCKENSTSISGQVARSSGAEGQSGSLRKDSINDIMGIFESVALNETALVFRHRLDSQKRGRYKKMILRHMDFDTIRSKISNHSIASIKELFRDLLLLANNAVVFYSRNTREYKSALLLRTIVLNTMLQHFKDNGCKPTIATLSHSSRMHKSPVKPRTAHLGRRKMSLKVANAGNSVDEPPSRAKRSSNVDSPPSMESLAVTKKSFDRPRKIGLGNGGQRAETASRGRKRSRAR